VNRPPTASAARHASGDSRGDTPRGAPVATGGDTSGDTSGDAFRLAFDRVFGVVAFMVNRHLVDHFMRVSRQFDLDYETIVIWAVLAHQNCVHLVVPGAPSHRAPGSAGDGVAVDPAAPLRPLRLRDLTQITGIARETVRRKLLRLHERGWIVEARDGWIIDVRRIDPDLRDFTEETARRLLSTARAVQQALDEAARVLNVAPNVAPNVASNAAPVTAAPRTNADAKRPARPSPRGR
jgi:hypothetical protein